MNPVAITITSPEVIEVARVALVDEAGEAAVGNHIGAKQIDEVVFVQAFSARMTGYRGWYWSVLMTQLFDESVPSVSDISLLPGEQALRAPQWRPWSTRVQPGDHGVAALLPEADQDQRLVPGFASEDLVEQWQEVPNLLWWQVGIGRKHLLSVAGRDQVVERWYASPRGPNTEEEVDPAYRCASCAFYVPLSGAMGAVFGGCVNVFAHEEGKVVSFDHGCSAHSELPRVSGSLAASTPFLDELGFETIVPTEGDKNTEISDEGSEKANPQPPDSIGFDEPWPDEEETAERGYPDESADDRNFSS